MKREDERDMKREDEMRTRMTGRGEVTMQQFGRRWSRASLILAAGSVLAMAAMGDAPAVDTVTPTPDTPWRRHLGDVHDALGRGQASAAGAAWHEALSAALGTRRWDAMVEVGEAYRLIGETGRFQPAADAKARGLYLNALFRARQARSVDGVLRTAQAFAALGDREVVERCIAAADGLAVRERDAEARARVRDFTQRFAAGAPAVSH